ncbi:methyl-accepting chemotaxis sensory transducer [Candidatus Moduliflexus flocculans]|uniref:Methyl-accepting chemotaxis sensory transducer n=1 Tax=Candidatus Moduliflexus flocculans TaxID=1499966 RepID=A0A0S6VWB1_9BACT|nr:methyl-accepting chemotaxis sensory transducer [Candidatus Moduliflexus flocculans]
MLQHVRLKTRMIIYICSVASVAFLVVIMFFVLKTNRAARSQATREAHEIAYRYGNVVKLEIEVAFHTARAMAQMFEGMKSSDAVPQRAVTNAVLRQVLETYPQFLGVWTCWEPNQFDGRDAEFAGTPNHDATGRYIPYWVRTSAGPALEPLKYYDVEGDGDWYLRPKKSKQETLLDPFTYPIEGKDVLMTTISVPIIVDQTVVGVTGVDIALTTFEEMVQHIHPFNVGSLAIIAHNGMYVAHVEHEKTGQMVAASEEWPTVNAQVEQGRAVVRAEYAEELHSDILRIFVPVQLGMTTTPWAVAVTIPMKPVLHDTTVMVYQSVGLGVVALALMIAAIIFIARSVTQPLQQIICASQELARGNFAQEIVTVHHDEIGDLAHTYQEMKDTIRAVLTETEMLITAVQEGQLITRGHAQRFQGEWQALILGINRLIDAFADPITVMAEYIQRIAQGDLTETLRADYQGDFKAMMQQVQAMATKLTEVVRHVKTAAQDVAQRSREMNVVAEQMSQGASQQAAATEEVSASMQEMAANIHQSADNAKLAENMALKSAEDARAGNQAVTELIQAMEVIAERISIVQEIASQTNMLSLNATIEASRAQEYGKGFSVVASSVRELAHQTRTAADEIRALVHSSVVLSAQAGEVLQRLVPNSEKTAELVQEISVSSQEQSRGVEQVNLAVQQLDSVTQHTAATAEEVASTAESLTLQADALQQAMAFFTVKEIQAPSSPKEDELLRLLHGIEKERLVALLASLFSNKAASPIPPVANINSEGVEHLQRLLRIEHKEGEADALDEEFERY